jgi:uncharacterized membrane protein (GlpM family)
MDRNGWQRTLLEELLLRFLIGGAVVSGFSVLGDLFRPKSFAGLFGAAPSVALATLALTVNAEGPEFVAIEARSMVLGAIAFFVYASCASWLMMRYQLRALAVTSSLILVWLFAALGLWSIWMR